MLPIGLASPSLILPTKRYHLICFLMSDESIVREAPGCLVEGGVFLRCLSRKQTRNLHLYGRRTTVCIQLQPRFGGALAPFESCSMSASSGAPKLLAIRNQPAIRYYKLPIPELEDMGMARWNLAEGRSVSLSLPAEPAS